MHTARIIAGLVGAALCALPALVQAETDPGIAAAIRACVVPGASMEARIDSLAAAGWLTQSDTPAGRDRYAAFAVLRLGSDFAADKAKFAEMFEKIRARPLGLAEPAGQAPTGVAVSKAFQAGSHSGFLQYELPAQSSSLVIQILTPDLSVTELAIKCSLMLGPNVPYAGMLALAPTEGNSVTEDSADAAPGNAVRGSVRITGADDGFNVTIDHVDLTDATGFTALLAEEKSNTPFSTLLMTGLFPVPLR